MAHGKGDQPLILMKWTDLGGGPRKSTSTHPIGVPTLTGFKFGQPLVLPVRSG